MVALIAYEAIQNVLFHKKQPKQSPIFWPNLTITFHDQKNEQMRRELVSAIIHGTLCIHE